MLATRFGNERGADGNDVGVNGRPEYVRKACDDSLRRLGTDVVDLYYQHRSTPTRRPRTRGEMKELTADDLARLDELAPVERGGGRPLSRHEQRQPVSEDRGGR